jgi:hypothetical protein
MIIFLDIDGVLRPTNSYIGRDEYGKLFIDECVDAFNYLLKRTGGRIVISSTWKSSGLIIMKEMWVKRGLPGEVIDITPNEVDVVESGVTEFYDMVDRGMEIDQWLNNNNYTGDYIIIDDVPDFTKEQMLKYIKTNPNIGLTKEDVDNYLNGTNSL